MLQSQEDKQNPVITFPIKKKISPEQFIDRWVKLSIQNRSQNFLAKWKRLKCWRQDHQEVGMKNHNSSLFRVNYING